MNTAIHGIIIYDKKKNAEEAFIILCQVETFDNCDEIVEEVFNGSDGFIEEINYRDVTYNREYIIEGELIIDLVNSTSIDLYL